MPTKQRPRIHAPGRQVGERPPDPQLVRDLVPCRICHVAAGDFCLRIRRAGRPVRRRHRNHLVRVNDAIRRIRG